MSTNDPSTAPDDLTGAPADDLQPTAPEVDSPVGDEAVIDDTVDADLGSPTVTADAVSDEAVSDEAVSGETVSGDGGPADIGADETGAHDIGSDAADLDMDVAGSGLAGSVATATDPAHDHPSSERAGSTASGSSSVVYTPVAMPKAGLVAAVLTLVAAAVGVVYFAIVGPTLNAYTIDGESVSREELVLQLADVAPDLAGVAAMPEEATPEERAQLAQALSGLIVEDLVGEAAAESGVEVSDADIDAELESILTDTFAGDQAAFDEAIASSGLPQETIRQQIRTQLLVEAVAAERSGEAEVSEEDVQAAYDAQFASGTVSHILLETEEEAQAALERVEGGEDFAAVATELSIDTGSGAQGGNLGPFQPGAFVPAFEEAVLATEPGGITGPVETEFGFHIITVSEAPALEDVRGDIEAGLTEQALGGSIQAFITELDTSSSVTVDPAYGEWVGLAQGGVIPPEPEVPELDLELPTEGEG